MSPPDDDPREEPHRPLRLGPAFWAALAFGLVCVLAGWALARYGPLLLPPRP